MIGGKILDARPLSPNSRASAAFARLRTARVLGIALYLPAFALAEVRAVGTHSMRRPGMWSISLGSDGGPC